MSIHDQIDVHIKVGALHRIDVLQGDPVGRSMVISNEINNLLFGPWRSQTTKNRAARLLADLQYFVSGKQISICIEPYVHKDAFMGRLDMPRHEIWDIRSRDPKPGVRVFGRFADIDYFVGLTWRPRSVKWETKGPLGNKHSIEWEIEKLETEQLWKSLFPNETPIHGNKISDYISANAISI